MFRRWGLIVVLLAGVLVPGVSSSALPRPTAGLAHVWICGESQWCENPPGIWRGELEFLGGLDLDNGSYWGTFNVGPFTAREVCGPGALALCRHRFDNAPISRFGFEVEDPVLGSTRLRFGPGITGSCSGNLASVAQITCSFQTSNGFHGTRKLQVVTVLDPYHFLCSGLCEEGGPPSGWSLHTGVYVQGDASLPTP